MEKPIPVKINMKENPKFWADALARHFTEAVMDMKKDEQQNEPNKESA